MNAFEFFEKVRAEGLEVEFDHRTPAPPARLGNEALFQLPLIAITVLMISKGQAKPGVNELGQLVGDCFERTFSGFLGSAQHLGWSASLRVRTVQALAFLEQAALVEVQSPEAKVVATPLGRKVLDRALEAGGDLAHNLVLVERSYRNVRVARQLSLDPA
ncbi:hypothetical protein ACW7GZ_12435 [Luteimonas sp. A537]